MFPPDVYPLCLDPVCKLCDTSLDEDHPNGNAPYVCFKCRVFWDWCSECNGSEAMRMAPVVGFGRAGVVTMLELPALPGGRYYALSDDPTGVWISLCRACGCTRRWADDDREAVVAEDFSDPRLFGALVEEQASIRRRRGLTPPDGG